MDDKTVKTSMEIILHAGDARLLNHKALTALAENEYAQAASHLEAAKKKLVEAHKVHTRMIQSEARGEEVEFSILFSHAQDTLMTISSEITLTKALYKVFESLNHRIKRLEDLIKD